MEGEESRTISILVDSNFFPELSASSLEAKGERTEFLQSPLAILPAVISAFRVQSDKKIFSLRLFANTQTNFLQICIGGVCYRDCTRLVVAQISKVFYPKSCYPDINRNWKLLKGKIAWFVQNLLLTMLFPKQITNLKTSLIATKEIFADFDV